MYDTHTPAEWAANGCLGVAALGVIKLALAFADADLAYFDPRPALSRAVESGRFDALLVAVANAKHDAHRAGAAARRVPRDVAATALLMLLALDAPGDTR